MIYFNKIPRVKKELFPILSINSRISAINFVRGHDHKTLMEEKLNLGNPPYRCFNNTRVCVLAREHVAGA